MKKRVFSLIVAAAMLFGMMPVTTLGADLEPATPVHSAVYAEGVTVNGTLSEAWLLNSKMTGTDTSRAFGTLWDSEALYLAIEKADEDTEVSATINNKALTITAGGVTCGDPTLTAAAVSVGAGHWEVKIPWSDLNVTLNNFNITVPAVISVGSAAWSGNIVVSSLVRYSPNLGNWGNAYPHGKNDGISTGLVDGGFWMQNVYVEGAENNLNNKARIFYFDYFEDGEITDGDDLVMEYDFCATAMPVYGAPEDLGTLDGLNPCYGFTYYIGNQDR